MALELAAALALVVLPESALAKEWVVDARGGADFSAIQPAVEASASGDVILVRSGRYPGVVEINGKQGLTISGEPGVVLVESKGQAEDGLRISQSERIAIEKLDTAVKHEDAVRIYGSSDVQLRGCRLDGGGGEGISIQRSQRVLVVGCRVMDFGGGGISIDKSSEVEVADTLVAENGSSGISVNGSAPVTLSGDTITRHLEGSGVYLEGASKVTITRSIIVFNHGQAGRKPGEAASVAKENYEEDPHFADLVKRDYRLRPSSPLAGKAASPETRVGALGVAAEVTTPYCPLPVGRKNSVDSITPLGVSGDGKFAYFDDSPFSPAEDMTVKVAVHDSRGSELFAERLSDFDPKRIEGLWAARNGFHELFASHGIDCARPPRAEPMPARLSEGAAVQVEAAWESETAVAFFAWTEGRARLLLGRLDAPNDQDIPKPLIPAAGFFRHPGGGLLTFVFQKQDSTLFFTVPQSALAPEKMGPRCGPQTAPADKDGSTHFVSVDKVVLREAPGRQAGVVQELEHNDRVRYLGEATCEEEPVRFLDESNRTRQIADRWYRVSTYERVGWIHGALIEPIAHQGHVGDIYALDFSPDGKLLASGGPDGVALIWDVAKGLPRARLELGSPVRALALDGRGRLAVGTESGGAQVWDWATGKRLSVHSPELGWVKSVAFSPDGSHVASVHENEHSVHVWQTATGQLVAKSPKDSAWLRAGFVGNDTVAYAGDSLWLWKFAGTDEPTRLEVKHPRFLAADSTGTTLLVAKHEEEKKFNLMALDPAKGGPRETGFYFVEPHAARYLPASKRFAVATCDDGVLFWPGAGKSEQSNGASFAKACSDAAAVGEAGRRVLLAKEGAGGISVCDVEKPQLAREFPVTRRNRD